MMTLPDTDGWPSVERLMLPSRAFLLSWREQTLPTRLAAIDDAADLFASVRRTRRAGVATWRCSA
jgi:hypothetical protein